MKAKETLQSKGKKQKEPPRNECKARHISSESGSRTSLKWGGYRNTATI